MTVLAVGVLLAFGGGLTGRAPALAERNPKPPPPQQPPQRQQQQGRDLYGCDRTFGHQPERHLLKRTNPAGGQTVHRGDSIVVAITWDPADWSSKRLHKVLDCVAIDGQLQPSLQDGESPTDNDGRFSTVVRVPADVADGAQICDQAMLSGASPRGEYDRQISNQVCHTVSGGASASCGQPQRCDRQCDERSPCGGGSRCDRGCAEHPPCDRQCGHGDCARSDSCDGDRAGGDRDGRRGKDCDCDRHREGLVRRLIHKLV